MDFDDNVIVPPAYYEIRETGKSLNIVRVSEKDNYKEGIITPDGTIVVPAAFESIRWCGKGCIVCCRERHCEMLHFSKKV